jgi:parvulin-like peptidyl-prolyl isomerase
MSDRDQTEQKNAMKLRMGAFDISPPELARRLRLYQMQPAIVRELTIDRAIAGVECTVADKAQAIEQFCERQQLRSNEQVAQWLDVQGLLPADLEAIALRQFKLEKFKQETWGKKVDTYYMTRKTQLDRVIYSLIRTEDLGIAQEVYFRLQDGDLSFADIAREYSQGPEAQTGGLIGPVELSTPHPAIAKLLVTNPPGHICPPIRIEQWFAIVRPDKVIPAQLDDGVRARLLHELFQQWLQQELKNLDPNEAIAVADSDTLPTIDDST